MVERPSAWLEKLGHNEAGQLEVKPEIRSDNGGGYISRDFACVLDEHSLKHGRIRPHCPKRTDW